MEINTSQRLSNFKTGIFTALEEKRRAVVASGGEVINFFVGTPDFTAPESVVKALSESAADGQTYGYTLSDLPELTQAVCTYYKKRFGVTLAPSCITSTNGSQEGIGHIGMALCNEGDVVLLPDPGYPVFSAGAQLCGAEEYYYPLLAENNFLPVLSDIPEDICKRAKYMVVSYPSNPVCAIAPPSFYDELIAFAKKNNIIIVHDNAYSDIVYDGNIGGSFLQHEGATDVGIEFFSLSKSFNLTGARVSFAIGNKKIIDALKLLRSQYDFGIFRPIQNAAIEALTGDHTEYLANQRAAYQARRDALCGGLRSIGWDVPSSRGTMFAWLPIPKKFATSEEFVFALLEQTGVFCTPGSSFGARGEGYVRFALTQNVETIKKAVAKIDESGILK